MLYRLTSTQQKVTGINPSAQLWSGRTKENVSTSPPASAVPLPLFLATCKTQVLRGMDYLRSPLLCHLLADSETRKYPLRERTLLLPAALPVPQTSYTSKNHWALCQVCIPFHEPYEWAAGPLTPLPDLVPPVELYGGTPTPSPHPWASQGEQDPPVTPRPALYAPCAFFGAAQDPPPTLPSRLMGAAGPPATPRQASNPSLEPRGNTAAPLPPPWGLTPAAQSLPEVRRGTGPGARGARRERRRDRDPRPWGDGGPARAPREGAGPPALQPMTRGAGCGVRRTQPPWGRGQGRLPSCCYGNASVGRLGPAPPWRPGGPRCDRSPGPEPPKKPQKPKQNKEQPSPQQTPNHPQKKPPQKQNNPPTTTKRTRNEAQNHNPPNPNQPHPQTKMKK